MSEPVFCLLSYFVIFGLSIVSDVLSVTFPTSFTLTTTGIAFVASFTKLFLACCATSFHPAILPWQLA